MSRLAIGAAVGLVVGVVLAAALGVHGQEIGSAVACRDGVGCTADPDILDQVEQLATEAGVEPIDLLGAVNVTGLGPRSYLIAVGELAESPTPPVVAHGTPSTARVRLTYYVEAGTTYSGGHTYPGSTACSWNFPLGTRFALPNGEIFTCNDRGLLGSSGWLDLWRAPETVARYGPFVTVEVHP